MESSSGSDNELEECEHERSVISILTAMNHLHDLKTCLMTLEDSRDSPIWPTSDIYRVKKFT